MSDELISQFIDDELDLEEKIVFVETVHADGRFTREALDLLAQERRLREPPPASMPEMAWPSLRPARARAWRSWRLAAGLAAAALLLALLWPSAVVPPAGQRLSHRFVVYLPDAQAAAITGSFSGWQPIPMQKAGPEGYWEITLPLTPGEHRYSFLLDDGRPMADPTVWTRETDDFGSQNSVLDVSA